MGIYYALLAGLAVLGAVVRPWKDKSRHTIYIILAFIILITISAIRYGVGYDYSYVYAPQYEQVLQNPDFGFSDTRHEPGFVILEKLTALISPNYQTIFLVTSLLTLGLFAVYYWLYSPNAMLSILMFIMLSQYYCSMNFIRQTIAAAICLFAFPILQISVTNRKKIFLYFLAYTGIVILGSTFHKSALILIPFFFICHIPLNKWVLIGFSAVTAAIYFNTTRIMELVTRFWYSHYSFDSEHMRITFEWPFTVAIVVIFAMLFIGQKALKKNAPENMPYISYAFFALFFTLMGTRHSILDRLGIYFELVIPIAVPLLYTKLRVSFPKWKDALKRPFVQHIKAWACAGIAGIISLGGLAFHHYSLTKDHHGVEPYRIIFNQPFYAEYVNSLNPDYETNSDSEFVPSTLPEPKLVDIDEYLNNS